ncbi:hypothetical protein AB5I41_23950 [Sphingomonas sp. MMS24-JH45]
MSPARTAATQVATGTPTRVPCADAGSGARDERDEEDEDMP